MKNSEIRSSNFWGSLWRKSGLCAALPLEGKNKIFDQLHNIDKVTLLLAQLFQRNVLYRKFA